MQYLVLFFFSAFARLLRAFFLGHLRLLSVDVNPSFFLSFGLSLLGIGSQKHKLSPGGPPLICDRHHKAWRRFSHNFVGKRVYGFLQ